MIAWLQGVLLEKQPPHILLNVNGVGYELEAPMTTFYELSAVNEIVNLHVHMVVREDAQLLFAFSTKAQRDLFRGLIKINGVGPKVALAVLSTMSVDELLQCVSNEDIAQLTRVPGIGKKTAERLLVEMKGRLESMFGDLSAHQSLHDGEVTAGNQRQDAVAALESLGYKTADVSRVVRGLDAELCSEEIIKQALRVLSGNVL